MPNSGWKGGRVFRSVMISGEAWGRTFSPSTLQGPWAILQGLG